MRQGGTSSSLLKHSPERLHLLLDHLCGRLTANERIGATEPVPEVVYLTGLLADEFSRAWVGFSLLHTFTETSCSGDRGIFSNPRGLQRLSRTTALVSDIIAPLPFADDPMQQAGSDHFMLAKLCRDVFKQGIAVGLRYGFDGLHQQVEFVSGQSQSQLVQWGRQALHKEQECGNRTLVLRLHLRLS